MNESERDACRKAWTDDEEMVAHLPPGYWCELIFIAVVKQWLISPTDSSHAERTLYLFESTLAIFEKHLHNLTKGADHERWS